MRRRVSFWWPQEVPARHLRILMREATLEEILLACSEKLKKVLKVTPRMEGAFARGIRESLILIWGWRLDWWALSGVNKVTEDLCGAMERPFKEAQSDIAERWE